MSNRPASVMSKSSVSKLFKSVKRPFSKKKATESEIPPEKKPDDRKDEVKKEEAQEAESSKAHVSQDAQEEASKQQDKVKSLFHPKKKENEVPSASNLPSKKLPDVDEEIEEDLEMIGNYAVMLDHQNDESMNVIRYGNRSYYTPNAVSIFTSLDESYRVLNSDLKFQDRNVGYYSVAVSLYYSVLYYIRILHVRQILGENTSSESRFYRAFIREFKLESLPVAGFLEPDFANIGFYEPKDKRVTFLLPQFEAMFNFTTAAQARAGIRYGYNLNVQNRAIQPNVPILYEWIHLFADPNIRMLNHRIARDTFVANTAAGPDSDFFLGGIEFQGSNNNHVTHEGLLYLSTLGIDRPVPESVERLVMTKREFQNSGFTTGSPPRSAVALDHTSIESFLRMEGQNWSWFRTIAEVATVHASQFNGQTNLGNIPARGSLEIGTYSVVTFNRAGTAAERSDTLVPLTNGQIPWFPHLKREATAHLTWYEPNYQDYHFKLARQSISTARIILNYSTGNDHADDRTVDCLAIPDGSQANAINTAAAIVPARYGPYWARQENAVWMNHHVLGARGESRTDMKVLERRNLYVRKFYPGFQQKTKW